MTNKRCEDTGRLSFLSRMRADEQSWFSSLYLFKPLPPSFKAKKTAASVAVAVGGGAVTAGVALLAVATFVSSFALAGTPLIFLSVLVGLTMGGCLLAMVGLEAFKKLDKKQASLEAEHANAASIL